MDGKSIIESMVDQSREAQKAFEQFNQQQVDEIVRAVAKVVYDRAEELARMAVDETRMGVFQDKIKKNQGKARIIWHSLKNKKSVGMINFDPDTGITEIARPMGVIGAVTPCTNPIVTPMCNAMFALKGRNSIIIAPHPRAKKCTKYVVDLFNEAIKPFHAPVNLIQVIEEPTVDLTGELMKAVDVVVATGGMGMVKAAYSSGKPAYGVGVGNVQCIIDQGVNIAEAISKIITGRSFDNGIICSAEQTVIVHEDDFTRMKDELAVNGAIFISDPTSRAKIRKILFPDGVMNKELVGQPVTKLAQFAGIDLPADTKVIAVEAEGIGQTDLLCKEKMCPVLTVLKYKTFAEAVNMAIANLNVDGKGHSISLHSNNQKNIEFAAQLIPVSRILVNQVCATMNGGSFYNGFAATTTLGCGSWGNNSISENLDYKHLINISRIGYFMKDAKVLTDAEIWG
jgi:succinate-semialdehyde dehydrogenase